MLKAPLFATLQLLQCKEYIGTDKSIPKAILTAMKELFKQENYNLLNSLDITKKFEGWEDLLKFICLENELMDVKNINIPDFTKDLTNSDYYVFAGYLKPGYHQILIYDPQLEKAFVKDFVVNLNLKEDLFLEYPSKEQEPFPKHIANVWRNWIEDSQEDMFKSF